MEIEVKGQISFRRLDSFKIKALMQDIEDFNGIPVVYYPGKKIVTLKNIITHTNRAVIVLEGNDDLVVKLSTLSKVMLVSGFDYIKNTQGKMEIDIMNLVTEDVVKRDSRKLTCYYDSTTNTYKL